MDRFSIPEIVMMSPACADSIFTLFKPSKPNKSIILAFLLALPSDEIAIGVFDFISPR